MVSCAEAQAYLEEQEQLRHRLQEAIHEVMTLISCGSTGMSDTGMLIPRISHGAHATLPINPTWFIAFRVEVLNTVLALQVVVTIETLRSIL